MSEHFEYSEDGPLTRHRSGRHGGKRHGRTKAARGSDDRYDDLQNQGNLRNPQHPQKKPLRSGRYASRDAELDESRSRRQKASGEGDEVAFTFEDSSAKKRVHHEKRKKREKEDRAKGGARIRRRPPPPSGPPPEAARSRLVPNGKTRSNTQTKNEEESYVSNNETDYVDPARRYRYRDEKEDYELDEFGEDTRLVRQPSLEDSHDHSERANRHRYQPPSLRKGAKQRPRHYQNARWVNSTESPDDDHDFVKDGEQHDDGDWYADDGADAEEVGDLDENGYQGKYRYGLREWHKRQADGEEEEEDEEDEEEEEREQEQEVDEDDDDVGGNELFEERDEHKAQDSREMYEDRDGLLVRESSARQMGLLSPRGYHIATHNGIAGLDEQVMHGYDVPHQGDDYDFDYPDVLDSRQDFDEVFETFEPYSTRGRMDDVDPSHDVGRGIPDLIQTRSPVDSPRYGKLDVDEELEEKWEEAAANEDYGVSATAGKHSPVPSGPFRQGNSLLASPGPTQAGMVQCVIVRDRSFISMSRLLPVYKFYFQDDDRLAMIAQKQGNNKTANYHIFDMSRGSVSTHLSKKSGNYVGKLRSNFYKTECTLYTESKDREELGFIHFERPGLIDQVREGSQPRKLFVTLPPLNDKGYAKSHKPHREGRTLGDIAHHAAHVEGIYELQSKEPVFENGNFRLNFHGRVTIPSVKNFQLVPPDDMDNIVCQFGKVGDDRFHLDYRAPLSAMQAFAVVLSQFNY